MNLLSSFGWIQPALQGNVLTQMPPGKPGRFHNHPALLPTQRRGDSFAGWSFYSCFAMSSAFGLKYSAAGEFLRYRFFAFSCSGT